MKKASAWNRARVAGLQERRSNTLSRFSCRQSFLFIYINQLASLICTF